MIIISVISSASPHLPVSHRHTTAKIVSLLVRTVCWLKVKYYSRSVSPPAGNSGESIANLVETKLSESRMGNFCIHVRFIVWPREHHHCVVSFFSKILAFRSSLFSIVSLVFVMDCSLFLSQNPHLSFLTALPLHKIKVFVHGIRQWTKNVLRI